MGQVLIVDDDATLRGLLRSILEEEGYRVSEAVEGHAALDLLRRSPARFVVLLDYLMPGADGKRVLQVVSQDSFLSTRHAYILLTARRRLSLPMDVARLLSLPVVRKPFDLEDLLVKVADAQKRLEVGGSGSS